jgi:hypothetical protein
MVGLRVRVGVAPKHSAHFWRIEALSSSRTELSCLKNDEHITNYCHYCNVFLATSVHKNSRPNMLFLTCIVQYPAIPFHNSNNNEELYNLNILVTQI